MLFFSALNFSTYQMLKDRRAKAQEQIMQLQLELTETETIFNLLDSVFNPVVKIQLIDHPRMGNRYLGRVRILEADGKKSRVIGFSIGRAEKYTGIDDKNLRDDAEAKAKEKIREYYPNFFTEDVALNQPTKK